MVAAVSVGLEEGCRLDRDVAEGQDLALVFKEVCSVLDNGLGDPVKVLNLVRFEAIQDPLKPFNETNFLVPRIHIGRAQLCNDFGVWQNIQCGQLSKRGKSPRAGPISKLIICEIYSPERTIVSKC
jgi:hypothetical protein